MSRENMSEIQCGRCNVMIPLLNQFPVRGIPTFEYHCTSCNGKVHLQLVKDRSGQTVAQQVRLTGSADEFRPHSIRPNEQVQIPVAYTLGSTPVTQARISAQPIQPPQPAYTLGGNQAPRQQLPPNHPMHPRQIRRRVQPIRLQE
jgi:hypothetical protein